VTLPNIGLAIAATGGAAPDNAAVERGIARLREQGVRVHNYYDHAQIHQRFGGTDAARLAQLHAAIADPDVQVVMALRGQYGITRLMPHIDFKAIADSGKIVVGYSDLTALHMGLLAKTGALSYAGPMICNDFSDEEGTIWGGNLAMMVSLLGTEWFPKIDGGILFLEDVAEHPYRVERMLLQMMQAGVLANQKAIVLGDFSRYKLSPADNGYDFDQMLAYMRAVLPVPILTGLPFGHIPRRATIPFGAKAQLNSDPEGFSLTMRGYPAIGQA
jgi:muramoyltetrapeptide carboxypeptidase